MSWPKWVLLGLYAFNTLLIVARVGKPRPPLTNTDAVANILAAGLLAWLVVAA